MDNLRVTLARDEGAKIDPKVREAQKRYVQEIAEWRHHPRSARQNRQGEECHEIVLIVCNALCMLDVSNKICCP